MKKIHKNLDEFNKIWDKVVLPLLDDLSESFPVKIKNRKHLRNRAKRLYNKYRSIFLKSYMYYDTNRIDKHKISACYMKAILVIRPTYLSINDWFSLRFFPNRFKEKYEQDFEDIILMNEYLSISVATTILDGYIKTLGNDKEHTDQPLIHRICFPKPFRNSDEEYLRDLCLDLYYTKPRRFNTITYANIFFLLEKYSCRKVQCDNLLDFSANMLRNEGLDDIQIEEKLKSVRFKSQDD